MRSPNHGDYDRLSALMMLYVSFAVGVLALGVAPELSAQTFGLQGKLFPTDTLGTEAMGRSVSLSASGNTALVGAGGTWPDCRKARVFQRAGSVWQEETVLHPVVSAAQSCGWPVVALAGDGQTAWVQDWVNDQAHVYARSGASWQFQQFLQLPDGVSGGSTPDPALSFDGNTALVGAPNFPSAGCPQSSCGAGFVYVRVNGVWSQQQQLVPPAFEAGANLGTGVALSGDGQTALLGDRFVNASMGAAYVFTRSGNSWTYQQKLEAPDGGPADDFGERIAVTFDGGTVLAGAMRHCHGYQGQVCPTRHVYSFDKAGNAYAFTQELTFPSQSDWSQLVNDIGISASGHRAVIGHPSAGCAAGVRCGAATFFTRSNQGNWFHTQTLVGVEDEDLLGESVDMSADGNTALIAAPLEDCLAGAFCGAVYAFVDSCPPGSFAAFFDCAEDVLHPEEWIFVGCAVVDCCPWCPGADLFRIDWVIRYEADPEQTATLRFDNISTVDLAGLSMRGPGTWLEGGLLQMSGGSEVTIAGFQVEGKDGLVRGTAAPRMTLDRVAMPTDPIAAFPASDVAAARLVDPRSEARTGAEVAVVRRAGRATLTVEQRVDGRVIDRTTIVYLNR